MSQTTENLLPAVSGQDLGASPSQEWDVFARDVSISGPINLVPSGEGEAGQVLTSGGAGNPAGWSSGGVTVIGGTGISVSTVGDTVTVTNTATATPASPDTSVQFNDGGAFGGSSKAVFDKTVGTLTITGTDNANDKIGGIVATTETISQDGTTDARAVNATSTMGGDVTNAQSVAVYGYSPGTVVDASVFSDGSSDVVLGQFGTPLNGVAGGFFAGSLGDAVNSAPDARGLYIRTHTAVNATNFYAIDIKSQNVATNNYGIKIGNIGLSGDNDYAIQTGWGKSQFGEDINLLVWPDDPTFSGLVNIPYVSHFIYGDASTNSNTVSHIHFYKATANSPGVILSSTAGTGAIPTIDIYGNTNHTYIDSGIFTIVNNSGVASTITTNNTGGDFPATGNSNGLQITAIGSGGGAYSGNALEVTGTGSDYEHSFGIQVQSASRALFTGGVQLSTNASRPTASETIRGTLWVAQGTAGVADKIQVVLKDAANAYAWHDITFV